jgi:hypothetical protein
MSIPQAIELLRKADATSVEFVMAVRQVVRMVQSAQGEPEMRHAAAWVGIERISKILDKQSIA